MALKTLVTIFDTPRESKMSTLSMYSEESKLSSKLKAQELAKERADNKFSYGPDDFNPRNPKSYRKGAYWMARELTVTRIEND